jgi:branched-chain amino acid transport system substrate-binding protein
VDAAQRLLTDGKPIDRANMRDYIETTNLTTLQGTIAFDTNGDLRDRTISLFQIKKDPNHPPDDMVHQYHYIGPAPQS